VRCEKQAKNVRIPSSQSKHPCAKHKVNKDHFVPNKSPTKLDKYKITARKADMLLSWYCGTTITMIVRLAIVAMTRL
jgi:hypothetical protein